MSTRVKVGVLVATLSLGLVAYAIHARRASREANAAAGEFREVADALVQGAHGEIYDRAAASLRGQIPRDAFVAALTRFESVHGRPKGHGLSLTAGAFLREAVVTGPRTAFHLDFATASAVPVEIGLDHEQGGYRLARLAIRTAQAPLELPGSTR